jgi:hypothetical protein
VVTDVSALGLGDLASPTDFRTTRQNDGRRHPGRSAERHLRVRSCLASMLGVGRLGPYAAQRRSGTPQGYRNQMQRGTRGD